MTKVDLTFQAPYVRDDSDVLHAAIVVAPSAAIERERPVLGESSPIAERALEQHAVFLGRLAAHGVKTMKLDAAASASLGSLCADSAIMFPNGAFIMRPSDMARRAEVAAVEAALADAGIPIAGRIEAPGLLDGGDVLLTAETAYLGVPAPRGSEIGIARSMHGNEHGREQLAAFARTLGLKIVNVPLSAEVLRLRSVASIVAPNTVLYAPGLLDADCFAGLERIEAPRGEDYAAGVLALGGRSVIANVRFRQTIPRLRAAKIAVDAIDLWEFGKIGATPSSLALVLKRG